MGRRCVACHGARSRPLARRALGNPPKRLCHWLLIGGHRRARHSPESWLARDVLGGRHSGAAGALHPHQSTRVGGVGTEPAGQNHRRRPRIALQHKRLVLYMVALLFFMSCLSHGTQDLYPDFLKHEHGIAPNTVTYVTMFYSVGSVIGAIVFGLLSERIGRRYSMLCALGLSLLIMPAWAFGGTLIVLALGAFVMQMGVQGAWGIIPVHLNELSPAHVRGLLPGFTYQIGILLAASTPTVEFALRDRLGYPWALTSFELVVITGLALLLIFGRENHGRSFLRDDTG